MNELARWLGKQLDEDERIANEAGGHRGQWRLATPLDDAELGDASWLRPPYLKHVELHDPARVLREIAIDRELLREYEQLLRSHARHEKAAEELAADIEHENRTGKWEGPGDPDTRQGALRREADYLPAMLHVVERWAKGKAAVYDQRPGFQEEWRP
jgi:hypothetical protein